MLLKLASVFQIGQFQQNGSKKSSLSADAGAGFSTQPAQRARQTAEAIDELGKRRPLNRHDSAEPESPCRAQQSADVRKIGAAQRSSTRAHLMSATRERLAFSQSDEIVARAASLVRPAGFSGSKADPFRATKRTTLPWYRSVNEARRRRFLVIDMLETIASNRLAPSAGISPSQSSRTKVHAASMRVHSASAMSNPTSRSASSMPLNGGHVGSTPMRSFVPDRSSPNAGEITERGREQRKNGKEHRGQCLHRGIASHSCPPLSMPCCRTGRGRAPPGKRLSVRSLGCRSARPLDPLSAQPFDIGSERDAFALGISDATRIRLSVPDGKAADLRRMHADRGRGLHRHALCSPDPPTGSTRPRGRVPAGPPTEMIEEDRRIAQSYGVFSFFGGTDDEGGRVPIDACVPGPIYELADDALALGCRKKQRRARSIVRDGTDAGLHLTLLPAAPTGRRQRGRRAARCGRCRPRGNPGRNRGASGVGGNGGLTS